MRYLALAVIALGLASGRLAVATAQQPASSAFVQDHDRGHDHDRDRDRDHHRIPRGTYEQTCRNIHRDGDTLRATCQKRNGGWRDTSLRHFEHCRGDIANINGKLQCR